MPEDLQQKTTESDQLTMDDVAVLVSNHSMGADLFGSAEKLQRMGLLNDTFDITDRGRSIAEAALVASRDAMQ